MLPITKAELDIGTITTPYVDIAHCIRAALWISHDLRKWVKVTIAFNNLGPLAMTLDPRTIRYMGTDERSILHIILRAQEAAYKTRRKIPHGVTLEEHTPHQCVETCLKSATLLLLPGKIATWQDSLENITSLLMYCPLHEQTDMQDLTHYRVKYYKNYHRRDIAILELVHTLDMMKIVLQKD